MADMLFLKRGDGEIMKAEGDKKIHEFVEITREAFDHIPTVGDIYMRLSLIERDPIVRDRIMARLFLLPNFLTAFDGLSKTCNAKFKSVIRGFKDRLSYTLFPASVEITKAGVAAALIRSLTHIPEDTSTYFQQQHESKFN